MKERRGELARSVTAVFAGVVMAAATFTAAALLDPNGLRADASAGYGAADFDARNGRLIERTEPIERFERSAVERTSVGGDGARRELDEARNPEDTSDGVGDDLGRPGLRKPRGITPPWREHAIPELRKRPDRKTKKYHA